MDILYAFGALLLSAPAMLFIFIILMARKKRGYRSIGLAADCTTMLLFFSVPSAVSAFWKVEAGAITCSAAVAFAIVILIFEWKKSKELEIPRLMRKTWRVYFLVFSIAHFLICTAGLLLSFNEFFKS